MYVATIEGGVSMKVFISADIEGVTGVTHWDETEKAKADHEYYAHQMTLEVKAACEGAISAGADEIWIKDAHDSGRNIDHNILPKNTKLIRGWSGHYYSMMQGLDETFDAVILIGYHSAGGTDYNPLAHTNNTSYEHVKLNGVYLSEFVINSYMATCLNVPIVFLSGDLGICEEAKRVAEKIVTVPVKEGVGNSTINIHPQLALELIKKGVEEGLNKKLIGANIKLPNEFKIDIKYHHHADALRKTAYPNVEQTGKKTIAYYTDDFMELVKSLRFLL